MGRLLYLKSTLYSQKFELKKYDVFISKSKERNTLNYIHATFTSKRHKPPLEFWLTNKAKCNFDIFRFFRKNLLTTHATSTEKYCCRVQDSGNKMTNWISLSLEMQTAQNAFGYQNQSCSERRNRDATKGFKSKGLKFRNEIMMV